MTEEIIRERVFQRYGRQNFDIIEFSTITAPVKLKCNRCNCTIELKHLQNLYHPNRKNFCPHCAGTYNGDKVGKRLPLEEAQSRLDNNLEEKYDILSDSYKGWASKALIRHSCGKIFKCSPRDLLYHSHCPCIKISSKGERKIKDFLINNKIFFEEQKRLDTIKKAPYDFFLPDYNLLIEFQGRQHYEPVEKFGGEKQFEIQQEIDKRKNSIAKEQGYNILYISYKDINSIDEILVQRLALSGVDSSESKR